MPFHKLSISLIIADSLSEYDVSRFPTVLLLRIMSVARSVLSQTCVTAEQANAPDRE